MMHSMAWMRQELTRRGISYPPYAKRAELERLLRRQALEDPEDAVPGLPPATEHSATGICTCGRGLFGNLGDQLIEHITPNLDVVVDDASEIVLVIGASDPKRVRRITISDAGDFAQALLKAYQFAEAREDASWQAASGLNPGGSCRS